MAHHGRQYKTVWGGQGGIRGVFNMVPQSSAESGWRQPGGPGWNNLPTEHGGATRWPGGANLDPSPRATREIATIREMGATGQLPFPQPPRTPRRSDSLRRLGTPPYNVNMHTVTTGQFRATGEVGATASLAPTYRSMLHTTTASTPTQVSNQQCCCAAGAAQ